MIQTCNCSIKEILLVFFLFFITMIKLTNEILKDIISRLKVCSFIDVINRYQKLNNNLTAILFVSFILKGKNARY